MTQYAIKVPYLSTGLKRSYNKQLIVYEGEIKKINNFRDTFVCSGLQQLQVKGWKYKKCSDRLDCHITNYYRSSLPSIKRGQPGSTAIFDTLELAISYKYLLLDDLKREYLDNIRSLEELCRKNIPDVTEEVNKIKTEHPELFI